MPRTTGPTWLGHSPYPGTTSSRSSGSPLHEVDPTHERRNKNMTRSRLAGGLAVLALTASACGMGGGDAGQTSEGEGGGSGNEHVVYAEFYPPIAAWALET